MAWCFFCEKEKEGLVEHHVVPKWIAEFLKQEQKVIFICQECHEKLHQYGTDPNLNVVAPLLYELAVRKKETLKKMVDYPSGILLSAVNYQKSKGKPGIEWLLGYLKAMEGF